MGQASAVLLISGQPEAALKNHTIRYLDRFLGVVLCWTLTVLRRIADAFGQADGAPPRKLVFLKLVEQGATVLAADAIAAAVEKLGKENVYFCVFPQNRFILDALDLIPPENVICVRSTSFGAFALDSWRAVRDMRRIGIDALVDMEFFSRGSAILAFMSGARRRVGLHRFNEDGPYRGDLMTHRILHNPHLHVSQAYRVLVESLWLPPNRDPRREVIPPAPRVPAPLPEKRDVRERVELLLKELAGGALPGAIVLINASPADELPLRRWPLDRFVGLGRELLKLEPDVTLGFTGSPVDQPEIARICRELGPRALCLAGRTTLDELLALYQLSRVLVTSDGGPAQFAALTPIHNIVLFGPETPAVFGPLGKRVQALSSGMACSPCFNAHNHRSSTCTNNACLQAIGLEDVLTRVRAALRASGA